MKKVIKNWVLLFLTRMARIRLRRLRPFIIGVTGSVGKTSTKAAIHHILKSRFKVFTSEKSYNTEFGLPLSVLGLESGYSDAGLWMKTLLLSVARALFGAYDLQMMVLEMGTDKPGDMTELLKVVTPHVGVITNIKPVHLGEGQFKDLEDIALEKTKLVFNIHEKGVAVLNADDGNLAGLKDKLKCKTVLYGFSDYADLKVNAIESSVNGIKFELSYGSESVVSEVALLGKFEIYVVLAAVAVAITQGFSLQEAVEALKDYKLPPGRMNPIEGINESLIIDSSYNSSPETAKEALEILCMAKGRKIAVLGSMNELGGFTVSKHKEVGEYAVDRADFLITVGMDAKNIAFAAESNGFNKDMLKHFETSLDAAEFLKSFIKKGDTILVKGSQNKVRLERLVKVIMKDPEKASELLARQEKIWQKI